jgi:hypothetical protein
MSLAFLAMLFRSRCRYAHSLVQAHTIRSSALSHHYARGYLTLVPLGHLIVPIDLGFHGVQFIR